MRITFDDIATRFEGLIHGDLERETVDRWAWTVMQAEDAGEIEYVPPTDEARIWRGVTYFYGIDIREDPESYLHTMEDIHRAYIAICNGPPI